MLVSQFIIFKTDEGNESCIYPSFPIQTVSINKEKTKFHFIEVVQLINEQGIIEYHHFANLSKSMDVGMNHQYLLIPQRRDNPILCTSSLTIHHYPLKQSCPSLTKRKKKQT